MDFKAAFAHLKHNPGEKLRFWFCARDGSGRPAMLVAPPHQKITQQETRAISKNAKNRQFCVGELEVDGEGTLLVAPFHSVPHALDMGVKFVAREHECTPKAIRILTPRAEAEDGALATKSLDPSYLGEQHKNAWGADNLGLRDDGEGGLRPPTEEEVAARREFTGKRTKYQDADERAQHQLNVAPGGEVTGAQGQRLDKAQLGVVMSPEDGSLYTFGAPKKAEIEGVELRYHHSTPFAGGDVAAAGHLYTVEGRLIAIDDSSGHYKPSAELTLQLLRALAARDATVDRRQLVPGAAPQAFREIDPAAWERANAALARPREMLQKLDTRRQQLCAAALAAEAEGAEDKLAALLVALDDNAADVERLCEALDRHLDAQLEPLGISAETLTAERNRLRETEWLDAAEFTRVAGDMEALRALIEGKPGGKALELPPALPASVLGSRDKLNAVLAQFARRAAARGQVMAVKDGVNAAAPRNKEAAVFLQGKQGIDGATFKTLQRKWLDDDKAALKAVVQALPAQAAGDAALLDEALGADPERNQAIAQLLRTVCREVFQRPPSNIEDSVNTLATRAGMLLVADFNAEPATAEVLAAEFKSRWHPLLAAAGPRLRERREDLVRYFDERFGQDEQRNAALRALAAGAFVGRGVLNLTIGEATRLRLSASQFEASGGNEAQARRKRTMLEELRKTTRAAHPDAASESDAYALDALVDNEPRVTDGRSADGEDDDDDDDGWMNMDDSDDEYDEQDENDGQAGYHQPDHLAVEQRAGGDGGYGDLDPGALEPEQGANSDSQGLGIGSLAPEDGGFNGYDGLDTDDQDAWDDGNDIGDDGLDVEPETARVPPSATVDPSAGYGDLDFTLNPQGTASSAKAPEAPGADEEVAAERAAPRRGESAN